MGENGENAVVNGEGAQQQPDTTVQQQQTDSIADDKAKSELKRKRAQE